MSDNLQTGVSPSTRKTGTIPTIRFNRFFFSSFKSFDSCVTCFNSSNKTITFLGQVTMLQFFPPLSIVLSIIILRDSEIRACQTIFQRFTLIAPMQMFSFTNALVIVHFLSSLFNLHLSYASTPPAPPLKNFQYFLFGIIYDPCFTHCHVPNIL